MELLARWRSVFCELLAGAALLLPGVCQAQQCSWMNAATAQGVLGGQVTLAVSQPNATTATCVFTRMDDPAISLEIEVYQAATPPAAIQTLMKGCRGTRTLVGVGNEAMGCTLRSAHEMTTEQVVGRVRDQMFIVRRTSPAVRGNAASRHDDTMQAVAESVAGNLF